MKFKFVATQSIEGEDPINPTEIYLCMETENETLDVLLKDMTKFLHMSGYQFDGTLKLVDEK